MYENKLKEHLKSLGASLVGFADLRGVDTSSCNNMGFGVAFGIKIRSQIIKGITDGPTGEYYEEYNRLNSSLNDLAEECVKYIKGLGYNAIGQTTTYVTSDDNLSTPIPHKTVATRAGLGWIGKNALLVTPEYGSAIRISSVITDMPLETDKPINESNCGTCTKCTEECPTQAIKGNLWSLGTNREELVDAFKCRKKARELSKQNFGVETSICGKCIEVCPFTNRYLKGKE